MEITTTKENLVEKLKVQITKNVAAALDTQELTDDEKQANLVIAKRNIDNDAKTVADLVFLALAE